MRELAEDGIWQMPQGTVTDWKITYDEQGIFKLVDTTAILNAQMIYLAGRSIDCTQRLALTDPGSQHSESSEHTSDT